MTTLQVNVRKNYCEVIELVLPLYATVAGIKRAVFQKNKIECDNQYLTYLGRLLQDDEKVTTLKPKRGALQLRLVLKDQPRVKVASIPKPTTFNVEDEKGGAQHDWAIPQLHNLFNLGQNNVAQVIHFRGPPIRPQGEAPAPAPAEDAQPAQAAPAQPAARVPAAQPARANRFWDIFRFFNVFLLFRLFLFVHIFARGEPEFQSILFIACGCYYLWRVGLAQWVWRKICPNRRRNRRRDGRNNNARNARNNNARRNEPIVLDRPLTRRELIERFLVGLFASLFPMWRPPVVRIRVPQNQEGDAPAVAGDAVPNNEPPADNNVPDADDQPENNPLENNNHEHEHQD